MQRIMDAIAYDIVQVDNAMKWGFAQEIGPFETWDAIGVAESVERMKADGLEVPKWVLDMLSKGELDSTITPAWWKTIGTMLERVPRPLCIPTEGLSYLKPLEMSA